MQDGQFLLSAYLLCANLADLTYIKYGFERRFSNVPFFGLLFLSKEFIKKKSLQIK